MDNKGDDGWRTGINNQDYVRKRALGRKLYWKEKHLGDKKV